MLGLVCICGPNAGRSFALFFVVGLGCVPGVGFGGQRVALTNRVDEVGTSGKYICGWKEVRIHLRRLSLVHIIVGTRCYLWVLLFL